MDNIKQRVIDELDNRIGLLREHYYGDKIKASDNQYEELNQALSKVIAVPLLKELESIKEFTQGL